MYSFMGKKFFDVPVKKKKHTKKLLKSVTIMIIELVYT